MSAVRPLSIHSAHIEQQTPATLADLPAESRRAFEKDGFFGLGQSYIKGEWSTGALDQFLHDLVTSSIAKQRRLRGRMLRYVLRERLRNPQIGRGAFEVGERHYDLGNDLFTAMLDSTMSYTCGYWKNATTLEQAQLAKLRLTCEKLDLKPGMRVLDIGCGWGNWAAFASSNYGVSVTGLTISKEQASLARDRCKGLPVEILLQDYRTFSGQFDRVVSIEMIEAVGRRNLPGFFEMIHRCLTPNGLFLLQAISAETFTSASNPALDQYVVWLLKHIFPNGYLPKMREIAAPSRGLFIVEDVHNFGTDYDKTLLSWDANFESAWPEIKHNYGEEFRRMWRYYLNGCAAMFRAKLVQLYQVVYSKGGSDFSR